MRACASHLSASSQIRKSNMAERLLDPLGFTASAVLMLLPIPLVIATRPPTALRVLVFALQLQLANWGNKTFTLEDTFITYSLGCLYYGWPLFTAIHFYFLTDPLTDGTRHIYDTKPAKDMSLPQRLWWATCLVASFRGVGWNKPVGRLRALTSLAISTMTNPIFCRSPTFGRSPKGNPEPRTSSNTSFG